MTSLAAKKHSKFRDRFRRETFRKLGFKFREYLFRSSAQQKGDAKSFGVHIFCTFRAFRSLVHRKCFHRGHKGLYSISGLSLCIRPEQFVRQSQDNLLGCHVLACDFSLLSLTVFSITSMIYLQLPASSSIACSVRRPFPAHCLAFRYFWLSSVVAPLSGFAIPKT